MDYGLSFCLDDRRFVDLHSRAGGGVGEANVNVVTRLPNGVLKASVGVPDVNVVTRLPVGALCCSVGVPPASQNRQDYGDTLAFVITLAH